MAGAFLAVILHGIYNSEVALSKELGEKGLLEPVAEGEAPLQYTAPSGIVETR